MRLTSSQKDLDGAAHTPPKSSTSLKGGVLTISQFFDKKVIFSSASNSDLAAGALAISTVIESSSTPDNERNYKVGGHGERSRKFLVD